MSDDQMKSLAMRLCKRQQKLESDRGNFESHWQEVANWILPERDFTVLRERGSRRRNNVFDSTAAVSNERLAAALVGMLVNPALNWFDIKTFDDKINNDREAKKWLSAATKAVYGLLGDPRSNFYPSTHEMLQDLCGFGTGVNSIRKTDYGIRMKTSPLGACYIDENSDGMVDTIFWKFKLTARQVIQRYGSSFDAIAKEKLTKSPSKEHEILWAVYPNDKEGSQFAYRSVVILVKSKQVISDKGFHEFPFAAPRWSVASGELYGRGPGIKVLPEIKMVNKLSKVDLVGSERLVDPPIEVPHQGYLRPPNLRPGGINYTKLSVGREGGGMRAINLGQNPQISEAKIEQKRNLIRESYFMDLLTLPMIDRASATEMGIRQDDRMQMIAPYLARIASEYLDIVITFAVQVAIEKKMIDPMPEILQGKPRNIHYVGPMALAQRSGSVNPVRRLFQDLLPAAQIDPTVWDVVKFAEVAKFLADKHNVPAELVREASEVEELKKQRDQQQQQLAQAQAMQSSAAAGADIAGAINDLRGG